MLLYNSIYDANHCAYRFLCALEHSKVSDIYWDNFRIIDFYSLFPSLVLKIKPFPREAQKSKKFFSNVPESYADIRNTKKVMYHLQGIHNVVVSSLIAKGLIDIDRFKEGVVTRTDNPIPDTLQDIIQTDSRAEEKWYQILINDFPKLLISGEKGLKRRTGLMEYRYDDK